MAFQCHSCVLQGLVLEPILFILYTAAIGSIVAHRGLLSHFYANESQLYLSGRNDTIPASWSKLNVCISEIDAWMASNKLKLNQDKIDILWHATKQRQHLLDLLPLVFGGATINLSFMIRDLGNLIASDLSMLAHVNQLVIGFFHQLHCITSCHYALAPEAAKTLMKSCDQFCCVRYRSQQLSSCRIDMVNHSQST